MTLLDVLREADAHDIVVNFRWTEKRTEPLGMTILARSRSAFLPNGKPVRSFGYVKPELISPEGLALATAAEVQAVIRLLGQQTSQLPIGGQ